MAKSPSSVSTISPPSGLLILYLLVSTATAAAAASLLIVACNLRNFLSSGDNVYIVFPRCDLVDFVCTRLKKSPWLPVYLAELAASAS